MESTKEEGALEKAPTALEPMLDPVSKADYKSNPVEVQRAVSEFFNHLPEGMSERFLKTAFFKALQGELKAAGVELPAELEARIYSWNVIPAMNILKTEYPPLRELVPGMLAEGLSFLVGRPKVGKSWLAMQLAYSVMTGGMIFGQNVEKGKVLYFALEDSGRRLQKRMMLQQWPMGEGVDYMLFDEFQNKIGALNNPESNQLLLKYIQRNQYRLVIVDTFSRSILGDQLKADEMTAALGPLQHYAVSAGVSILIVDHMPKNVSQSSYDAIGSIFGSVAKAGVADSSWAIYRESGKEGRTILVVTGREIEDKSLQLTFDKEFYYWRCEGVLSEVRVTRKRQELLDLLSEIGPARAIDIAHALDKDYGFIHRELRNLINNNQVELTPEGLYQVIDG